MRIWSLHPKYLDTKGLVALWRETLLAKYVLEGKTKGYIKHPQLIRFKKHLKPLESINYYLEQVYIEAKSRDYNFNKDKFISNIEVPKIEVTTEQLTYEVQHLLNKLNSRDINKFDKLSAIKDIDIHPLFVLVDGGIAKWEILSDI